MPSKIKSQLSKEQVRSINDSIADESIPSSSTLSAENVTKDRAYYRSATAPARGERPITPAQRKLLARQAEMRERQLQARTAQEQPEDPIRSSLDHEKQDQENDCPIRLRNKGDLEIKEVAEWFRWSTTTVWRHFVKGDVPGVVIKPLKIKSRRPKRFVRIPFAVAQRERELMKTTGNPKT